MISVLLAAVIQLSGVSGNSLRARAFFDANNVKVGDPMVLTIDFLGEADFHDLHPPALARHLNRKDWKLDDTSAKTETYRDARRLTYRVRPMREGVLWFPALEFGYEDASGRKGTLVVRSNEVPVHAKVGTQVVVAEMAEDPNELPSAPDLVTDATCGLAGAKLSDDVLFQWRKACANAKADAFTAFDFPAARLNEASCAIREGNWARALKIYSRLEWTTGQTPEIERGIVSALALRYDNPSVELPVWRQVGRPLLKFGWQGRCGIVVGGLAALMLLFWLLGRGIRAVASVGFALLALQLPAQGIFEQMEREMQRMHQRMNAMSGGFSFGFGEKEAREPVKVVARLATSTNDLQVGTPFEYVVSLEAPKTSSIGQIQMRPSQMFGLKVVGEAQNLTDGKSANPTNVVKRLAVPVRYDVPFKGEVSFTVEGMVSGRQVSRGGNFSFSFSNSFSCRTEPVAIDVKPLAGAPADFSGIVSEGLRIHETLDLLRVETNDVVQVTYRMYPKGFVPADFLPPGAAFEMNRDERGGAIEYRRFFVADGAPATPKVSVSYYDPRTKAYRKAETGGTRVIYTPTSK